jgi:hypothetical protein
MSEQHRHPFDINHRGGVAPDGRPSPLAAAVDAALDAYAAKPSRGNDLRVRAAIADRVADYYRLAAKAFDGAASWPTEDEREGARVYTEVCAGEGGDLAGELAAATALDRAADDIVTTIVLQAKRRPAE